MVFIMYIIYSTNIYLTYIGIYIKRFGRLWAVRRDVPIIYIYIYIGVG